MNAMLQKCGSHTLYKSFILIECLIWGVGNAVTKIGLESISPFYCLAIRFFVAFFVLLAFFGKGMLREIKQAPTFDLLVVCAFTATSFITSTVALKYSEATTVGFLRGLSVVFTPFLFWLVLKKKPAKSLALIIALVVAGLYFLCGNTGSFRFGPGELLALLSALSLAGMLTYSSRSVQSVNPMTLATVQSGFAAVVCLVFALLLEDYRGLSGVTLSGWAVTLYLALGCTCVAYFLQNYALKKVTPVFASLAFCTEPIFTMGASFFILGETLSARGMIGAVFIIAGLISASLIPSTATSKETAADAEGLRPVSGSCDLPSAAESEESI